MEIETKPGDAGSAETLVKPKRRFLQELKEELAKVSWTTKDELRFCTKTVIGVTFVLGIGIYLVDLFIKSSLDGFGAIVRLIFG
jgi:preprotein translocase subunit SecE